MDGISQYVISVISAALICALVSGLTADGHSKTLIRLLCGLFLTLIILQPISGLDLESLTEFPERYSEKAEDAASQGEIIAEEAVIDSIESITEAYILDKASAWNAELEVNVTVSDACIPVCAELHGEVSPYVKQKLAYIIETDLGITKENQIWTG